jgi:peptide/nickel transport system permease protein
MSAAPVFVEPQRGPALVGVVRRHASSWWPVASVVTLILLAVFVAPEAAPYGSTQIFDGLQLAPPSWDHPFGTDVNQMDVLSRVLTAARLDVGIAAASTAATFVLGYPLGLLLGYFHGPWTGVALRLLDMVQAFPVLVLALAIVALTGGGAANVIYAQIFVATPIMIRVVRAVVLRLREERFVESAIATGNSDARLLLRHIAPHALPVALIQATILMAGALILTTGLSFIGVGVHPPTAEWGLMVGLGSRDIANGDWWTIVFPGAGIALAVFAFNLLGQLLRRRFPGADVH